MKLSEAKEKFKDEWLAFDVKEEGEDPDGVVVFHNKSRKKFDKELVKTSPSDIYITFAGKSRYDFMLAAV